MGSRGDCFDDAVAESFFATLKKELIHSRSWPTKAELRTEVFEYIEIFFNRRRRHSTLGFLSPEQYETITPPTSSESTTTRLNRPHPPKRGNSNVMSRVRGFGAQSPLWSKRIGAPALAGRA